MTEAPKKTEVTGSEARSIASLCGIAVATLGIWVLVGFGWALVFLGLAVAVVSLFVETAYRIADAMKD